MRCKQQVGVIGCGLCVIVAYQKSPKLSRIGSANVPPERVAKRSKRKYFFHCSGTEDSPSKKLVAPSPEIPHGRIHGTRRECDRPVDVWGLHLLTVFDHVRCCQPRHNRARTTDPCIGQANSSGHSLESICVTLTCDSLVEHT